MKQFFVYVYLDPRKPGKFSYDEMSFLFEPFYVGKGKGRRFQDHLKYPERKRKGYFKDKLLKILSEFSKEDIKNYILILRNNLIEQEALDLEKELIEKIGRADLKKGSLTNLTDGGEGTSGLLIKEETRKKLSDVNIGKKLSKETRKKLSDINSGSNHPNFGKKFSEEAKKKMSNAKIGKELSNEHKRKLHESKIGGKHSEEAKKKMSKAKIGKKHSEETRKKLSKAHTGKKLSEEAKKKISDAMIGPNNPNFGKKVSKETKKKMSEARLKILKLRKQIK